MGGRFYCKLWYISMMEYYIIILMVKMCFILIFGNWYIKYVVDRKEYKIICIKVKLCRMYLYIFLKIRSLILEIKFSIFNFVFNIKYLFNLL